MFSRLSLASIFDNMRARSSQKERDRIEQLASNSSRNKTNKKKRGLVASDAFNSQQLYTY